MRDHLLQKIHTLKRLSNPGKLLILRRWNQFRRLEA